MRVNKRARNIVVSTIVLLLLFIAAGVAYTLIMDQKPAKATAIATPFIPTPEPSIKAVKPAANAAESAAVEAVTSPVAQGSNALITIGTLAASKCTISVLYNNVASIDSGLTPKIANDYGVVSWSWTVDSSAPIGTWPISITCAHNGKSAVVQSSLQVTKQ